MRTKALATMLMIATSGLLAHAQAPGEPPTPTPAPEETRVVRTVQAGGEVRLEGGNLVVFARDAQTPTKAAFLGVNTSSAPPALQKQLQLKPGVGLVVDGCEAGSPADKAGVKEYDVLHKLDDQLLINTEQLGVLVRGMDPGKDVKLTIIREGAAKVLPVKLGERDVPMLQLSFANSEAGLLNVAGDWLTLGSVQQDPILTGTLRLQTPDGKQELTAARITIENDKHKMTVSSPDGRKHLRVEDKEGKILFDGPISTQEEFEKVPADLRQAYTDVLKDYTVEAKPPPVLPTPTPTPTLVPKQR